MHLSYSETKQNNEIGIWVCGFELNLVLKLK